MKRVIITESQLEKLVEARMEGFRLDVLRNASFRKKVEYCKQMLGNPIGNGSSRMVFQLDDNSVLKLAKNNKGIAQNRYEIGVCGDGYISYVPNILNGTDTEDYLWIICEYVLPAKKEDFTELLGITFEDLCKFIRNLYISITGRGNTRSNDNVVDSFYEKYEDNEDLMSLFGDLHELLASYDNVITDLTYLHNWGLVNRDYGPELVYVDTGFNDDVRKNYYARA